MYYLFNGMIHFIPFYVLRTDLLFNFPAFLVMFKQKNDEQTPTHCPIHSHPILLHEKHRYGI